MTGPLRVAVVGVTVLISFFPTLVNMNVGFKTIDPRIYELMRLLNASRTQIFLKVRFPSAIPFLFSSLKITATLAFVGAIVGEWMAGSGINPIGQALDGFGLVSCLLKGMAEFINHECILLKLASFSIIVYHNLIIQQPPA